MSRNRLIGIVGTLVFLGLAFYRVDINELAQALRSANYTALAPAAVCTLLGYVLRTVRWRQILTHSVSVPFISLFGILMIGFATNNLVPARLGEIARAYLVRRRTGIRKTFFIATIFLERVFDGLVLILILFAFTSWHSLPEWGRELQILASAVFFGFAAIIAIVLIRQDSATRVVSAMSARLPSRIGNALLSAFELFIMGLISMKRLDRVMIIALVSCTIWLLEGVSYYFLALGFDLRLSQVELIAAVALLLVMVNLGIMIPSAPGYVGTFQFFAIAALSVFQVSRETALALSVVSHLMQYALVTLVGLFFLGREQVNFGLLFQRDSDQDSALPRMPGVTS